MYVEVCCIIFALVIVYYHVLTTFYIWCHKSIEIGFKNEDE